MKNYKRLKDPIYGYISIPMNYMNNIVDTPAFQRLRRIIQTSYSPLYSSAVHNRFVHSLGVYHLGVIVAAKLENELIPCLLPNEKSELYKINNIFLLSCLLHDVGHAPFSHTGEELYLDGSGKNKYVKIHEILKNIVNSAEFSKDVPSEASISAAPHEIMSAIVGIKEFPEYLSKPEEKELFARCITGYKFTEQSKMAAIKNCYITLLNSKIIDVDKLDYLIRDAYITGFNTVNIDFERLLNAITYVNEDENIVLAYYKDAVSVIENVVYAHDAERKWIQNHPIVLYEGYILQHIFKHLSDNLDDCEHKLFSYESLTWEGHNLKNDEKVSLLCDDDVIYLMKNKFPCEMSNEYFERCNRRHPLWKSEAEYEALFSGSIGGQNDSTGEFEKYMNATASYLSGTSDTWMINSETIEKVKRDLENLDKSNLDDPTTITVQKQEKKSVLRLMSCLNSYAIAHNHECDFVILEASQFNSGFGKPDFSKMPIVFNTSDDDYVDREFGKVAKPLSAIGPERKKFYYLFYRRLNDNDNKIDKKELCEYLTKEFTTLKTHSRDRK